VSRKGNKRGAVDCSERANGGVTVMTKKPETDVGLRVVWLVALVCFALLPTGTFSPAQQSALAEEGQTMVPEAPGQYVETAMSTARSAFASGNWSATIRAYADALKQLTPSSHADFLTLREAVERSVFAARQIESAVERETLMAELVEGQSDTEICFLLGRLHKDVLALDDVEQALTLVRKAATNCAHPETKVYMLGSLLRAQRPLKQFRQMIDTLNEIFETNPTSPAASTAVSYVASQMARKFEANINWLTDPAVASSGLRLEVLRMGIAEPLARARAEFEKESLESTLAATSILEQFGFGQSGTAEGRFCALNVARAYLGKEKKYQEALDLCLRTIGVGGHSPNREFGLRRAQAALCAKVDDKAGKLAALTRAAELFPLLEEDSHHVPDRWCRVMLELGSTHQEAGENENAVSAYRQVIERFPGSQYATKAQQLVEALRSP